MHGFAHRLIAAEREGEIGDAAGHMGQRHLGLDGARGFDKIDAVILMLLDAGRYRENIGIEDDVLRREADFIDENFIGALGDREFALECVGLALFVEGHHHDGGAVALDLARLVAKLVLAFLHRDRIDDALALQAFEPGFDHLELRAVDHDRHARDVGLGGDEI